MLFVSTQVHAVLGKDVDPTSSFRDLRGTRG
jgi:hypothetical protein